MFFYIGRDILFFLDFDLSRTEKFSEENRYVRNYMHAELESIRKAAEEKPSVWSRLFGR